MSDGGLVEGLDSSVVNVPVDTGVPPIKEIGDTMGEKESVANSRLLPKIAAAVLAGGAICYAVGMAFQKEKEEGKDEEEKEEREAGKGEGGEKEGGEEGGETERKRFRIEG